MSAIKQEKTDIQCFFNILQQRRIMFVTKWHYVSCWLHNTNYLWFQKLNNSNILCVSIFQISNTTTSLSTFLCFCTKCLVRIAKATVGCCNSLPELPEAGLCGNGVWWKIGQLEEREVLWCSGEFIQHCPFYFCWCRVCKALVWPSWGVMCEA